MKESRFSKILTEGTGANNMTGSAGSKSPIESGGRPNGDARKRPSSDFDAAHASLYDDTLSRKSESSWRSVALIVLVLLLGAALFAFFAGGSSEPKPLINLPETPQNEASQPAKAADETAQSAAAAPKTAEPASETSETPSTPVTKPAPSAQETRQASATAPESEHPRVERASQSEPPQESRAASPAPAQPKTSGKTSDAAAAVNSGKDRTTPETDSSNRDQEVLSQAGDTSNDAATNGDETPEPGAEPPRRGSADFQRLLQSSSVASKLVSGGISTISFQDWRVVQQTNQETWIDLIGRWNSSGDEVHFIWSVNRESGAVRALSEAARNLERSAS